MNYNKSGLWVLLFCVLSSLVWFIYLVYGIPPVDLQEIEEAYDHLVTERDLDPQVLKKYWVSHPQLVAQGLQVYRTYCATCHGSKGLGDGPAGRGLTPPPRNLVKGQWEKGGNSIQLYQTLTQGIAGTAMAGFAYLSSIDRWALVHYIRSITKNEVKNDPKKLESFAKTTQ